MENTKMSGVVSRTCYMTMICWTMSILLPKKCMSYSTGGNAVFTIRETHRGLSFIGSTTSHSLSSGSCTTYSRNSRLGMVYAPPGSGYTEPEDETSYYPDTYEPMMEYPGTMRPGRTPENQPFSSLPIQDTDPDPVPWPHFQEIEWHHQWGSPHEHAIPMEEFIEMENRWATAEEEAAMRAGVRRNVRERREMEELENASNNLILDDDDDDEDDEDDNEDNNGTKLDLGEGVMNVLARADTATTKINNNIASSTTDDDDDDDDDDFLLDLGLDSDEKDDDDNDDDEPAFRTDDNSPEGLLNAMQSMMDAVGQGNDDNDEDDDLVPDDDDLDLDLDLGLLDDDDSSKGGDDDDLTSLTMLDDDDDDNTASDNDDEEDDQMVPLDDMIGSEDADDMGDSFDDGGYDIDDFEYDNDGGDMY